MTVLALMCSAYGFAPDAASGLEPQRPFVAHAGEQGRLYGSAAFRAFRETDGRGWTARFDEATGVPRWLFGAGIPVQAGDNDALVAQLVGLLERHHALFGFAPGTLASKSVKHSADTDTWYVDFDELRSVAGAGALPTYRGGISARIKHGNLVMLEVRTAPRSQVTGALRLSAAEAIQAAVRGGSAPTAAHVETSAEPMLLERYGAGRHDLRVTYLVRSRTDTPPGRWVSFVDAATGEVLNVHNDVRFVDGSVTGNHHERTVDGSPLIESPMPLAYVESGLDFELTDEDGNYFSLSGDGSYATSMFGGYAAVYNYSGSNGVLTSDDPDMTWSVPDATQAEIDTYVFLHQVRDWGLIYAPSVDWVEGPAYAIVNLPLPYVCNAFYTGGVVYFMSAGYGCNNTGQIADVVFHEWGHGFHEYSLQAGWFDGSLSEGAADTVAFLQTKDNYIAPYFGTTGWAIRDVAPNKVYPQNYDFSGYYVHDNGLIFGGSMWDLLQLLTDLDGEDEALATTSQILAGLLEPGPDIPGSFYAALLADDNDGDLLNGTPHVCELYDAFSQHGLGTTISGTGVVLTSHEPIESAEVDEPAEIEVELVSLEAGCTPVGASGAELHYRLNGGGEWIHEALNTGGADVSGELPGFPDGTFVEYYITGQSDAGTEFASPDAGEVNPYTYYVGEPLEVYCADFEADDAGWKVADGTSFEWGTPIGLSSDPAGAYSGTHVWGLDLTSNGLYGNGEFDSVKSLKVDTKHYTGVFLQYRRWLGVEDGLHDQAEITVNGDPVWTNWVGDGGQDHVDDQWRNHVLDLGGLADQVEAKIGFELTSDQGYQLGGWNVDDVCLLAPATPDNRLGITDFVAEVTSDTTVHLTWTNPAHRPLGDVKVIRLLGKLPTGEANGEVVELLDDPQRGEVVEIDDTNYQPGVTGYAVYASDGVTWLSWTVEGWNAATVDLVGDPEKLAAVEESEGLLGVCGCQTSSPMSLGGGWLLAALVSLRRRARR